MARSFKLLADENFERQVVRKLRRLGYDVAVNEKSLKNSQLIKVAKSGDRVLITHDWDFADGEHYRPDRHCGIVVVTSIFNDVETLVNLVLDGLGQLEDSDTPSIVCVE